MIFGSLNFLFQKFRQHDYRTFKSSLFWIGGKKWLGSLHFGKLFVISFLETKLVTMNSFVKLDWILFPEMTHPIQILRNFLGFCFWKWRLVRHPIFGFYFQDLPIWVNYTVTIESIRSLLKKNNNGGKYTIICLKNKIVSALIIRS